MRENRSFHFTAMLAMLLALSALLCPTAVPRATAGSLATGTEGWEVLNAAAESWVDPDGYLTARGRPGEETWYWSAPATWLGDQRDAMGGTLYWELRDDVRRGPRARGAAVILESGDVTLTCAKPREQEIGDGWIACSTDFTPGGWREVESGEVADAKTLAAALSDVQALLIRGTRHSNTPVGSFRRVGLRSVGGLRPQAPGGPKLVVDTHDVNFGDIAGFDTGVEEVHVLNPGSNPVEFSYSVKPQANGRLMFQASGTRTIQPGVTDVISVSFTPTLTGPHKGNLIVQVAGGQKYRVRLRGRGTTVAEVTPAARNFGKVKIGESADQTFTVRVFRRFRQLSTRLGGSHAEHFEHVPWQSVNVSPDLPASLIVTYRPKFRGRHKVVLIISDTSVLGASPTEVTLSGESVGSPPKLAVVGSPVDFGVVGIGTSLVKSIQVGNTGDEELEVHLPAELPAPYKWVSTPPATVKIPRLTSKSFDIDYSPTSNIQREDRTFPITSNDPGYRRGRAFTVRLQGIGATIVLPIHWEPLEFGDVKRQLRQQQNFNISRDQLQGATQVTVEQPIGDPLEWGHDGPAGLVVVPADGPLVIPVWFEPQALGYRESRLTVVIPQGKGAPLRIPVTLSGQGIE